MKQYYELGDTMIYFQLLADGLITLFIISSTWLIVVMAAERYIAVCHPLRARKLISLRRSRTGIVLVFLVCALSTIPIFLERKMVEVICDDGRVVMTLEVRSMSSIKIRRILWSIFFDFIPCAALVYFNFCLIIQIRKAKRLRDRMTPKQSVIRYSSSGTRTSAQRMSSSRQVPFNGSGAHFGRFNMNTGRLNSGCTEMTGSRERPSYDVGYFHNGVKEYSKVYVFYNGREKSSKTSCGPSSQSTENEFQALNDPRTSRNLSLTSNCSKKVVSTVTRRRPSDSALNSVTATLVSVVLLFLVLVSPSELLKFSVSYTLTDQHYKVMVTYLTNFMQVLNFSLNFVLYCAVNKTFRDTLRGLTCCCWLSLQGFCYDSSDPY